MDWPDNRKFAFSIIDDTDVSTYESIKPIYDLLDELGLKTTKTVWVQKSSQHSKNFHRSQTMEDAKYASLVQGLHEKGFEIAFHGAAMESSTRIEIESALNKFKNLFGEFPKMHVNHSENADNLYWGQKRFNSKTLQLIHQLVYRKNYNSFSGHQENSPYFWGDLCKKYIKYVRNFCYEEIDLLKINPGMPYHNEKCKYVNLWFSSVNAFEPWIFNKKIEASNLDMLERDGGCCILSTHFGKYFVENGKVNEETRVLLANLAKRNGWFVPVSKILDYLYAKKKNKNINKKELMKIEYKWAIYNIHLLIRSLYR